MVANPKILLVDCLRCSIIPELGGKSLFLGFRGDSVPDHRLAVGIYAAAWLRFAHGFAARLTLPYRF